MRPRFQDFQSAPLRVEAERCPARSARIWERSHRYLRLRPSPSEHLPVPDLREDPDPEYDPREHDLSERVLRKKLGNGFDGDFMSVSAPAQLLAVNTTATAATASPDSPAHVPAPSGVMPAEIRRLDLSQTPYGLRVKVGKKARRKFLQWLWTHTHCPVIHVWKDLGVRFWPRYVKEGHCFTERSCSLPEGMFCKPSKSVTKTFLRCVVGLQDN
ncbi:hypothetical protein HF521_018118 [Silurus meridionalis]|uniref:Noggin n=1 Tax=Silurus meridionalis TaxID=175797 RepID=A0A8T0BNZ0_SILME|nr:hypothetical protein HF521_018118 [Silurus meridionalis]